MVEKAGAYDLNIYEYLKYILEKQPGKDWTDEQLETIAPWNSTVKSICANAKKRSE